MTVSGSCEVVLGVGPCLSAAALVLVVAHCCIFQSVCSREVEDDHVHSGEITRARKKMQGFYLKRERAKFNIMETEDILYITAEK